jgi:ribonuclease P protein component
MPTLARLKKRSDFLRVAGLRRKWATPGLILQVGPTPTAQEGAPETKADGTTDDVARVGFTVSKKVGNSVERNRARRRLKAAASEVLPDLARPGIDLVVIGRRETLQRPYSLLLQDLRTALKRVGATKEEGRS